MNRPTPLARLEKHSAALFMAGLVVLAARHAQLWRREVRLCDQLQAERTIVEKPAAPKWSALVAAWNEADNIDAHIRSFLALNYPASELILCAGGTDDTLARAQSYEDARVIVIEQEPGEGKQAALARALNRASGELIYLTDADCLFDQTALDILLVPIVTDGEDVVTGEIRPLDNQMAAVLPRYLWASDVMVGARAEQYSSGLRGANTLLKRQALIAAGGFSFAARTGTDYQLAQRLRAAGYNIRHMPSSLVPTEYPLRLSTHRKRQSRWLLNLLVHGSRYGATDHVIVTARTVGIGLAMLLAPLFALLAGPLLLVPWALLGAHATGAKLRYALFAARLYHLALPPRLLLAPLLLTWVDFAVWASSLFDLIRPGRRTQW